MAQRTGAPLAINADAHTPSDFLTAEMAEKVGLGAGLDAAGYEQVRRNMAELVERIKEL